MKNTVKLKQIIFYKIKQMFEYLSIFLRKCDIFNEIFVKKCHIYLTFRQFIEYTLF